MVLDASFAGRDRRCSSDQSAKPQTKELKLYKPIVAHVDRKKTSHSKQKQRGATNVHICDRSFKIGETVRKTSAGSSSGGYIDSRTRILTTYRANFPGENQARSYLIDGEQD
eukprot:scaffold126150_cov60-Attheya_sp.AAC.15